MNLVMNNKLKLLYFTFFIFFFIGLLFINSLYKFITVVKPDHNYTISAEQYYNFKRKVLNKIIDQAINETYLIKNVVADKNSFTFDSVKTSIKFDLQINKFIDESELEHRINKIYIGAIKKIVEDFNSNRHLYNYQTLEKLYEEKLYESISRNQKNIIKEYDKLMASGLFTKYLPEIECFYENEKLCLNEYRRYYRELFQVLYASALNMEINKSENEEESTGLGGNEVMKILSDFEKYKDSFELSIEDARFKKNQYFKTKYSELLNSEFFRKYMPADFCLNYERQCFAKLGINFNLILSKHQLEMTLPFKVTYLQKSNVVEKSFFSNIPLNIAFAFTATYLFFIFTNKYFKRKIK